MQTLYVDKIKILATEIYKTLHSLNSSYISEILKKIVQDDVSHGTNII